jgi:hypothetical protein
MGLRAWTYQGDGFELEAGTLQEALAEATSESLVGSLSAFGETWLRTSDGGAIRYSQVERFDKEEDTGG